MFCDVIDSCVLMFVATGRLSPVVHQYDRFQELRALAREVQRGAGARQRMRDGKGRRETLHARTL